MSDPAVPSVIVASIRNIELPHELRQVRPRRLDNEVKMVAHQNIGVHPDAKDLACAPESVEKARSIMIVAENHAPIVAPVSDMIKSVGIQDSQWTRHNSRDRNTC